MLDFKIRTNKLTNEQFLETDVTSHFLLSCPQLNKGTAFSYEERCLFGLLGKLPNRIETLEEQVERAYVQYLSYSTRMQQYIYLNSLHSKNQILFYKLVSQHLSEMLPVIYTPIVGTAVQSFSKEYRQPRGLYISHAYQNQIDQILNNRTNPEIDIIVVTDGEGVLGIGDQGIGGMDIPVAKLMVYSLCGGIDPARTLPILLDTGTNNNELLNDSLYLGCKHPRINEKDYDLFIAAFVKSIRKNLPNAFLHWEDFGRNNAKRILDEYQNEICTFNDDIQGTGAVALAALLAACEVTKTSLENNKIIIFGAGSAGTGIAEQLAECMIANGINKDHAYKCFWLVDKQGLLIENDISLTEAQRAFARSKNEFTEFMPIHLKDVIEHVKPTVLIGCSGQRNAFNKEIIEIMSKNCDTPIIFPLSNPDDRCEATPQDIFNWSYGKALIATGTAFPNVKYQDKEIEITQCNNALVFPGIGLGVLASKAKKLSKAMILSAANTLCNNAPSKHDPNLPLLPPLSAAPSIAKKIAYAVAEMAIKEGLAQCESNADLADIIERRFWQPKYLAYRKKSKLE